MRVMPKPSLHLTSRSHVSCTRRGTSSATPTRLDDRIQIGHRGLPSQEDPRAGGISDEPWRGHPVVDLRFESESVTR